MDPKYKKFQELIDKDPTGFLSGLMLLAGMAKGLPSLPKYLKDPNYQPPQADGLQIPTTTPQAPTYRPQGMQWQSPTAYTPPKTPTPTSTFSATPQAPASKAVSDFLKTDFMKKNQEKKIPLERQMRWDPGRKKYIQVGKWMKEQAKEKAKRKKHE